VGPFRKVVEIINSVMVELIFISSPYSHKDKEILEDRVSKVSKFAAKLVSDGKVAISPIVYGHTLLTFHDMPSDWGFWKNYCETFITKCDKMVLLMLDGWKESEGVKGEIEFATKLGIPIEYIELLTKK
jgi:hypothetical protein